MTAHGKDKYSGARKDLYCNKQLYNMLLIKVLIQQLFKFLLFIAHNKNESG